jgi:predicted nucleic acid-binding protein
LTDISIFLNVVSCELEIVIKKEESKMKKALKRQFVYLDVCSLCRPFDDQQFLRIRLESDAINLILENVRTGKIIMAVSSVHTKEIEAISDTVERMKLHSLLDNFGKMVDVDIAETRNKAEQLVTAGFGIADAAHVAFAEAAEVDFVTCDDRLLKRCLKTGLKVWCGDPLQYCLKEALK